MLRGRIAVLATLAALVPAGLAAQDPPVETFDYTGHSGVVSGNVYVGPYTALLGGAAYDVFCVDGMVAVKESAYSVYVTPIVESYISSGAYSNQTSTDLYAQLAWLSMQFDKQRAETGTTDDWGAIHQAIWNLTGGLMSGVETSSSAQLGAATWEAQATDYANYSTVNLAEWRVLHAVDPIESQEFLVRTGASVPEPGTWFMLLSGLLGIVAVAGRRQGLI